MGCRKATALVHRIKRTDSDGKPSWRLAASRENVCTAKRISRLPPLRPCCALGNPAAKDYLPGRSRSPIRTCVLVAATGQGLLKCTSSDPASTDSFSIVARMMTATLPRPPAPYRSGITSRQAAARSAGSAALKTIMRPSSGCSKANSVACRDCRVMPNAGRPP